MLILFGKVPTVVGGPNFPKFMVPTAIGRANYPRFMIPTVVGRANLPKFILPTAIGGANYPRFMVPTAVGGFYRNIPPVTEVTAPLAAILACWATPSPKFRVEKAVSPSGIIQAARSGTRFKHFRATIEAAIR